MNLKEQLADWTDFDIAGYYLACSIDLMKYDASMAEFLRVKGVFNTNNPTGNLLTQFLVDLATIGILMQNDDGQFRWNEETAFYWSAE